MSKADSLKVPVENFYLDEEEQQYVAEYDPQQYPPFFLTSDLVVFTVTQGVVENERKLPEAELRMLMIRRSEVPEKTKWALPGGFVRIAETSKDAALRRLSAETNLERPFLTPIGTFDGLKRDPRNCIEGKPQRLLRIVSTGFLALIRASACRVSPGQFTTDARWFLVKEEIEEQRTVSTTDGYRYERVVKLTLTNDDEGKEPVQLATRIRLTKLVAGTVTDYPVPEVLATDGIGFDHALIIQSGLHRLRSEIETKDIAFNLLEKRFSMGELQEVYEAILGRGLIRQAFERKVKAKFSLIQTNEKREGGQHRSPTLYEFNPHWNDGGLW